MHHGADRGELGPIFYDWISGFNLKRVQVLRLLRCDLECVGICDDWNLLFVGRAVPQKNVVSVQFGKNILPAERVKFVISFVFCGHYRRWLLWGNKEGSIFFVFCALSISSFFERSDNFAVMDTGFPLCCALTPFLCIRIKSTSIPRVSQKTLGIVTARFSFGVWG